jgi:MFS transporter, UMF1 family
MNAATEATTPTAAAGAAPTTTWSHHHHQHHELSTEATWTSIFASPCWVSPLYYSTTLDEENSSDWRNQQQQTQQHRETPPQQTPVPANVVCSRNVDAVARSSLAHGDGDSDGRDDEKIRGARTPAEAQEDDEVLGWTLDACARGVAVMGTAVFVSSDLLRLAKEATCVDFQDEEWETECSERVFGIRPSSILTDIVMVVGLLSAFMMPLVGSIIDHTPYRRAVGTASATAMCVFILVQMLVMENHWFAAAVLQIFVAFSYTVHLCAVYAYLPELTPHHEKLTQYTARFSAAQYAGSVSFLVVIVGILSVVNRNERLSSSTISQSVVLIICCICFGYAWTVLFRPRPASQKVPENKSLLSAGFWKIYTTGKTILLHHSAIKWFLVSAAFTEAATTAFSTIAITYMTEQLDFTARENGIAILILLIFGVPGTRIAAWLTSTVNPVRSLQTCLIFWILSVAAATLFLREPGQQGLAYVFAMFWGLAIGWVYPTEKMLYVTIIPRGQEAELMGTYICACQMLSWLPPLIFTVLNEMGFSMRTGLFTLTLYFFASFCILFFVGDYKDAVDHAREIDDGLVSFATGPPNDLGTVIGACYEQFADEAGCQPGIMDPESSVVAHPDAVSTLHDERLLD